MATPGKPLPEPERRQIVRLREAGASIRGIARSVSVSINTVQKILRTPIAK